MVRTIVALCASAALALVAAQDAAAWGTGSWIDGRATYYGEDAWALHTGSCGFGFICPHRWSDELKEGYDVVAISDKNPLYNPPVSCGLCLAVQCRDGTFTDYFGNSYERTGVCNGAAETLSVKVKVVDTCPCDYAANAESNKRWCCGDMPHLDMSQWSLMKVTSETTRWGVFAIRYRTVDCHASIQDEAPQPPDADIMPDVHANEKPANLNCTIQGGGTSNGSMSTEIPGSNQRAAVSRRAPSPTPSAIPSLTPSPTPGPTPQQTFAAQDSQRQQSPTAREPRRTASMRQQSWMEGWDAATRQWLPFQSKSKGEYGSNKYRTMKAVYSEALKHPHTLKYYQNLAAYFGKRAPDLKRDSSGKTPTSAK